MDRVKLVNLEEGFLYSIYSMNEPICRVSGTFKEDDGDLRGIDIMIGRSSISNSSCFARSCVKNIYGYNYSYHKPENKLCENKLALLILAKELIEKKHIGDATDMSGMRLLREYRTNRRKNMQIEAVAEQAAKTSVRLLFRLRKVRMCS